MFFFGRRKKNHNSSPESYVTDPVLIKLKEDFRVKVKCSKCGSRYLHTDVEKIMDPVIEKKVIKIPIDIDYDWREEDNGQKTFVTKRVIKEKIEEYLENVIIHNQQFDTECRHCGNVDHWAIFEFTNGHGSVGCHKKTVYIKQNNKVLPSMSECETFDLFKTPSDRVDLRLYTNLATLSVVKSKKKRVVEVEFRGLPLIKTVNEAYETLYRAHFKYGIKNLIAERSNVGGVLYGSVSQFGELCKRFADYGGRIAFFGNFDDCGEDFKKYMDDCNANGTVLFVSNRDKAIELMAVEVK